jgi:lipopolysaccharide/colanic/teichoic acid biosynthesis glycosyltransferase
LRSGRFARPQAFQETVLLPTVMIARRSRINNPDDRMVGRKEAIMVSQTADHVEIQVEDSTWKSLLELMQYCDIRRLLYCYVFKRWFDFIGAAVALVVLSPFLLLVAFVIWLEAPGSVIFRQTRIGRNGRSFVILKFRTMIPDRRKARLPFEGQDRRAQHKTRHDPRVTRLGRLLRRTSIDELPQLINILRGEMSFIGPRPELIEIVNRYAPWQHQRHLVRPGLTGWWQVQGRSDLPMHEHTELDIYYIDNLSFAFDMLILLRTIRIVLLTCGAFGMAAIAVPIALSAIH